MNFTAILSAMNFQSVMNFSKVIDRMNLDATRLSSSATRLYFDRDDGPQDWTGWIIQWIAWGFTDSLMKLGKIFWAEREGVLLYSHVILAALFPIYIGSHASLRRPSSAAPPEKSKSGDEDDDNVVVEPVVEGLTPSDAIMFPVLAGFTLAGLYFLIKWLKDPALLNKILGWYFSALGVFGVGKLAADALNVGTTFIFPSVWSSSLRTYYVDPLISRQVTGEVSPVRIQAHREIVAEITNPLPGICLSSKKFPEPMTKRLWSLRALLKSHWILRGYFHHVFSVKSKVQIQDITGFILGVAAITLYNTWGKLWFLTNLMGFGFCYGTLQLLSPTTFWTGSLVLAGLFIYDITMVFYTPLMVTVATSLDVPIKLVFPSSGGKGSMLGLGDIVLPGIMIALALRFDLYLHYLRKQTPFPSTTPFSTNVVITKVPYVEATGKWGERFWTWGAINAHEETVADGSRFRKTYFMASMIGYIAGMGTTLAVLKVYNHAQPALLYLVPGVLIALWGTAAWRGEFALMWGYTEEGSLGDAEEDGESKGNEKADMDAHSLSSFSTGSDDEEDEDEDGVVGNVGFNGKTREKAKKEEHIFLFSLSAPKQKLGVPQKAKIFDRS